MAPQPPTIDTNHSTAYAPSPASFSPLDEHNSAFSPAADYAPTGSTFKSRANPGAGTSSYARRGLTGAGQTPPTVAQPTFNPPSAALGGSVRNSYHPTHGRHPLSLSVGSSEKRMGRESLLPRLTFALRHPTRPTRVAALVALAVLAWWTFFSGPDATDAARAARTRWWDPRGSGKLPQLLPSPRGLNRPVSSGSHLGAASHELSELLALPSTGPSSYSVIVHLSQQSDLRSIDSTLNALQNQRPAPQKVTLLCADDLALTKLAGIDSKVYDGQPPLIALFREGAKATTDYVLFVDGGAGAEELPDGLASTLLHAAGTESYGSALLSAGGVLLPPDGQSESCVSASQIGHALPIHAPSSPFLAHASWLAAPQIANGARVDLALELALSVALWRKAGVPAFAIPVERAQGSCLRLEEQFSADDADRLGVLFAAEQGAGEGLGKDEGSQRLRKGSKLHPAAAREDAGSIVLLVSGAEELAAARPLACSLAGRHDLRVLLADAEGVAVRNEGDCHLAITALKPKTRGDSVSLRLASVLDNIKAVEMAIYVQDSVRAREWDEVLRWRGGVFGPAYGGKRRTRDQQDALGGTVCVVLKSDELALADWMGSLDMGALRQWHTPQIDISVVTNNRPGSLGRLLSSLQHANYFGDEVALNINMEQTADRATQRLADGLHWPDGHVTVRHRIVLGGLIPAIVESWYPSSNDSYGVLLEDDIEVSPFFYGWLKMSILQYRYSPTSRPLSTRMFGISLYQPRNLELRPPKRIVFDAHKIFGDLGLADTVPYLSQIPCSWGAVYFPEVWREFHSYLSLRFSETGLPISDPIVPEIMSNHWPRSWKKYFIELVYMRGYVMLYPNYADFVSLSTNHFEVGTHVHENSLNIKKKQLFWVPLMQPNNGSLLDLPEGKLPAWQTLPILDLWGSLATDDEIVERGWQSVALLDTCPPFRLDIPPTYNARELLCAKKYADGGLVDARPLAPVVSRPRTPSMDPPTAADEAVVPPKLVPHPVDGVPQRVAEAQADVAQVPVGAGAIPPHVGEKPAVMVGAGAAAEAVAHGVNVAPVRGNARAAGVHAHAHDEDEGETEDVLAPGPLRDDQQLEEAEQQEQEEDVDEEEDVEPVLGVPDQITDEDDPDPEPEERAVPLDEEEAEEGEDRMR